MKFITSIYGSQYLTFLLVHLYSVLRNHPNDNIVVMLEDLSKKHINFLKSAFPTVNFLETNIVNKGGIMQMIPRKLHLWNYACKLFPNENICFIDCDTIMLQPISRFFEDEFDVLFTWKNEKFPLNTGVLLIKNNTGVKKFMDEWTRKVEDILNNVGALDEANKLSGAADQHVLRLILDTGNYNGSIKRNICGNNLIFKGVPCKVLNETNSVLITNETHIIHYKAGWHPILIDGKPFSRNRPEETSKEMYGYFIQTLNKAKEYASRNIVFNACNNYVNEFHVSEFEERGILHSEMLCICAVCNVLDIDVLIESGRARGQSTLMFAKNFANKNVKLISIELNRDSDALFGEERLKPYENVELFYGDSYILLPKIVKKLRRKNIAVLLDGPKGEEAIRLFKMLLYISGNIQVGFFHDTRKGTVTRDLIVKQFSQVFFTDDEKYIDKFKYLDKNCLPKNGKEISIHTWRPFMKGKEEIKSYGPTIAVVFPTVQERKITSEDYFTFMGLTIKNKLMYLIRKWRHKL